VKNLVLRKGRATGVEGGGELSSRRVFRGGRSGKKCGRAVLKAPSHVLRKISKEKS